jgi:cytochrome c551/c552
VQVSTDNPTGSGLDIKNLTPAGANAFVGNTCVTAVNAPCPSVGPSLTASPNPIPVAAGSIAGQTTLSWNAPDAQFIEIHLGSPNGQLFTFMGNRGSIQTGPWVADGTTFYLQDVTGGNPRTVDYTLAMLVVHLQTTTTNGVMPPRFWDQTSGRVAGIVAALILLCLSWAAGMRRWRRLPTVASGGLLLAALLYSIVIRASAQSHPTAQQTSAEIDRMTLAHKGRQELAQYVFDTQGCKSCHKLGQGGKLGFTSRGQRVARDFEGCIRLLTDVSATTKVADGRRSEQQQHKVAQFQEFGCTFCHQVKPGGLDMSPVGAKLSGLHLGCVDIERTLASVSRR